MSHTPPVPEAAQSPYPVQEQPHQQTVASTAQATDASAGPASVVRDAVAPLTDKVGPLADKATSFVRARPYAAAALFGTLLLGTITSLRGRKQRA
jgi:hypothetical protein